MTQTLEKKKYSIKTDFSLLSILLIPIGVALNVVGDQLVAALSLPLYLDSFGAVLAGYLAGPWVGMLTGVLTNVLTGIVRNPTLLPYAITNGCIGLMAGLFARAQWPNGKLWKVALMLLIMSVGTIWSVWPSVPSPALPVPAAFPATAAPLWPSRVLWQRARTSGRRSSALTVLSPYLTGLFLTSCAT